MVAETVVVVIGILIAVGLDACWEGRAAAIREQAHLRALASDFEQNVQRLRTHTDGEERISSSSLALLEMARRPQPAPRDSVTRLLGRVFSSGPYEPVMGAYEALVNSAGLTAIGDDSLRAALADFSARVNGRYFERYSDELYFAFIREFAGRLGFFDLVGTPSTGTRLSSPIRNSTSTSRCGASASAMSRGDTGSCSPRPRLARIRSELD